MLKSVLVAYDGSAAARAALEHACYLASLFSGKVYVTHVVELPNAIPIATAIIPGSMEMMTPLPTATSLEIEKETRQFKEQGQAHLDEACRVAARWGLACEARCEVGFPYDKIRAQAESVDLLALGKFGPVDDHTRFGKLAEPIARHVPQPVLLASPNYTQPSELILIFNGGEKSHSALTLGAEIAAQARIPLTLITLAETPEENTRNSECAARYLHDHNAEFQPEALTSREAIDSALLGRIKHSPTAVVVMGAFRGTRLMEWLTGDPTLSMIRDLPNPMIVCSH